MISCPFLTLVPSLPFPRMFLRIGPRRNLISIENWKLSLHAGGRTCNLHGDRSYDITGNVKFVRPSSNRCIYDIDVSANAFVYTNAISKREKTTRVWQTGKIPFNLSANLTLSSLFLHGNNERTGSRGTAKFSKYSPDRWKIRRQLRHRHGHSKTVERTTL